MNTYSKTRLLQNIAYLMRVNNVKVGELESYAEVSPGYLSRLKNNENDEACPSIDILMKFCDLLNCNVVVLLYCDLANLTETESFIYNFLEALLAQTTNNSVLWEKITETALINSQYEDHRSPLLGYDEDGEYTYRSLYTDDRVALAGPIYKLSRAMQDFYIAKIKHYVNNTTAYLEYELYLVQLDGSRKKICNSTKNSKKQIVTIMPMLYDAAAVSSNILKIDDDVQQGLKDFLSGDDDKLPF